MFCVARAEFTAQKIRASPHRQRLTSWLTGISICVCCKELDVGGVFHQTIPQEQREKGTRPRLQGLCSFRKLCSATAWVRTRSFRATPAPAPLACVGITHLSPAVLRWSL